MLPAGLKMLKKTKIDSDRSLLIEILFRNKYYCYNTFIKNKGDLKYE
jgi:hypothetical protein